MNNSWNPICAVLLDSEDPGAEFESMEEAQGYLLTMEKKHGRSGEDREFPMIVSYSRKSYANDGFLPF